MFRNTPIVGVQFAAFQDALAGRQVHFFTHR